ncbi:MAG TPA: helix-turn-helix domain-containing protein [Desulfatiglandales bacterium]|nr:helix-turn-helix domain-containing protein [Desulfatiglandales bacterium]
MEETSLLRSKQVAKLLNIGTSTVYKLADQGTLPSVRWQGDGKNFVRFKYQDIVKFIEAHSM